MAVSTTFINTPCTIVRRGSSDDGSFYGVEPAEDPVTSVCEIQQRLREEPAGGGEWSRTLWDAFFLPDAPAFDTGDALLVGDEEFEFVGAPWRVRDSLTGRVHHVEATAVRTAGPENLS